jgi:hypothetical protein
MNRECKKCLLYESAEADMLESIKEKVSNLSYEEKADDELYNNRLAFCKQCDNLISGVCMKCGCYVEFRAAFKKMKCPDASHRMW